MQLIADSGSTKVSWRAILDDGSVKAIETVGINPVFMEDAEKRGKRQSLFYNLPEK